MFSCSSGFARGTICERHNISDTHHTLCYDEDNRRWLLYTRPPVTAGTRGSSKTTGVLDQRNFQRRTAIAIGETPQAFHTVRGLRWPSEDDTSDYDHFHVERAGSHYIGLLSGLYNPLDYNCQICLAFSGDGIHWGHLPGNPPLIPLGRAGEFDSGQTRLVQNIVDVGEEYYLYCEGSLRAQEVPDNEYHIGLARMPRDRFVVQMGDREGGYLLTREVVVSGRRLTVNMMLPNTAGGSQRDLRFAVELVRSQNTGNPGIVESFSFVECRTKAIEGRDVAMEWKSGYDLGPLAGKPVMIRFFLRDVGLYSFRFVS